MSLLDSDSRPRWALSLLTLAAGTVFGCANSGLVSEGAKALAACAGSIFTGDLTASWERLQRSPRYQHTNHDLTRLVGKALALVLHALAQDKHVEPEARRWSKKLADVAEEQWLTVSESTPSFGQTHGDLATVFASAANINSSDQPELLSHADCRALVEHLDYSVRLRERNPRGASVEEIALASERLHQHMFEAIRDMFKRDFAGDGRAYAALCLDTNARILSALTSLAEDRRSDLEAEREQREQLSATLRLLDERRQEHLAGLTPEQGDALAQVLELSIANSNTLRDVVAMLGEIAGQHRRIDNIEQLLSAGRVDERMTQEYWDAIRRRYRITSVSLWRARFPRSYFGEQPQQQAARRALCEAVPWMAFTAAPPKCRAATPRGERPAFIATQGLRVLNPVTADPRHLTPAAFLSGRESEQEARARKGAEWLPVDRAWLVRALCELQTAELGETGIRLVLPKRLFFVTGGGVGKSTNVRWLEAALNQGYDESNTAVFALLLEAEQLVQFRNAFRTSGLDQATEFDQLVAALTHELRRKAGRPSEPKWASEAIAAGLRRHIECGRLLLCLDGLDHVAPAEIAPYLQELQSPRWNQCGVVLAGRPHALAGWADPKQDFDTRRWLFIQPDEFTEAEAKVYLDTPNHKSRYDKVQSSLGGLAQVPRVLEYLRELSDEELEQCHTPADLYLRAIENLVHRTIKEGARPTREPNTERVLQLLAALAFLSLCPTTDGEARIEPTRRIDLPSVRQDLESRLGPLGRSMEQLDDDLRALGAFSTMIWNGVVNTTAPNAGPPKTLVWSSRTVQEFLAAYWLSRCASAADAERMSLHVFRAEEAHSDNYYEFNVFLAEMPADGRISEKWVAAAKAWYTPDPQRTWPSEMLYRSWPTLHAIAGVPLDDWWNVSYEALTTGQRLRSLERLDNNTSAAMKAALEILSTYQGGLQRLLNGASAAVVRELIENEAWRLAPAHAGFKMGCDRGQGFPAKTQAYWQRVLTEVQCGKRADAAARECTPSHWFYGASGERLKARDIAWLTQVLEPLERDPRKANPTSKAYLRAWSAIEHKWRRRDETPREDEQAVAAFEMHRYPVLHRWYRLFAPAHAGVMDHYLGEVARAQAQLQPGEPSLAVGRPPDDHPVIYVTWYDAWAFCQWARWKDDATGVRYGLRLPHEIEWEYAARWAVGATGPAARNQRYWWGDDFYENSDGVEEPIRNNPVAHADGAPGATRAPASATPNGLELHDMLGNVWEWMANIYDTSEHGDADAHTEIHYSRKFPETRAPANPQRAMRGGLWYYLNLLATVSNRFRLAADDLDYKVGFRVIREKRISTSECEFRPLGK